MKLVVCCVVLFFKFPLMMWHVKKVFDCIEKGCVE